MQMLTDARRAEIRARERAATPGPWKWTNGSWGSLHDDGGETVIGSWVDEDSVLHSLEVDPGPANAAFIAHARADVPDLLDENEALIRANARLASLCKLACAAGRELYSKLGDAVHELSDNDHELKSIESRLRSELAKLEDADHA